MAGPAHDPLLYPPPSRRAATPAAGGHSNKWGPYRSAGDFSLNMALVLLILACALAFIATLSAALRFFLRRRRRRRRSSPPSADPEKQEEGAGEDAGVAFAAGMEMAGAAAECAICLAEFAEGERVRVLPACSHGFHAKCIEAWVASKPSCPTCRSSCLVAAPASQGKMPPSPSGTV